MGSRETASTVSVSASHSTQKWLRSPLEWPRLLPARLPRLPRCPNRCLHLLSLLASCPPALSLMELRLLLVRSPPSLRKEFLELPPLSILRRLAVCSPLEMVLPVFMGSRTSRLRRWWNSAPASRAWHSIWSPTMLVLSSSVMTNWSRKEMLSRGQELLWMSQSAWKSLDVLLTLLETPLTARVPLELRRDSGLD